VADRNEVCQLFFVNVDRAFAFHVASNLSCRHHIEYVSSSSQFESNIKAGVENIDAVLLGTAVSEPVATAQRIHAHDKRLPIFILSADSNSAKLRQDIMFCPFLGHEVLVWPNSDVDGLAAVLTDAAERRQQRLRYQEAAIANAHVQLEVLPLLQPGAAQYVEGLFDNEPIGVIATDPDGRIHTLNRQSRQILDTTDREAIGTPLQDFFPDCEHDRIKSLLDLAISSNSRLSPEVFELPSANGMNFFVEMTAAAFTMPDGKRSAMVILQEVTLRVQAERQRTEAVVELRLIANALRAFHAIGTDTKLTRSEKIRRVLRLGCEQFGVQTGIVSQIDNNAFLVLESVSDIPRFAVGKRLSLEKTYCATTIDSSEPVAFECAAQSEWRQHSTYKDCKLEAYIGMRIIVDGKPFGTLCFVGSQPRTRPFSAAERETLKLMSQWIASELGGERAEAHMRKLSSAIEQTADSLIITDFSGRVEYINPAFEALTGFFHDEIVGHPAKFLDSDGQLRTDLWKAIGDDRKVEFLLSDRTKNDRFYHLQMTISPLRDEAGTLTHFIATGRDVTALIEAKETDRKRQAELTHVARLSTLGGMVSGLAHELNQPLCAIMTYAQTCLRKLEPGDSKLSELKHGLTQIVRQAERADEIFVRIRNFSRKKDIRRQRSCMRTIVQSAIGFVQTEIHHNNVKLKLRIPKNAPLVFVDAIQIQQVLINLVRNSIDALAEVDETKRTITIEVTADEEKHTKVLVTDNGCGCAEHDVTRLFEPFFTTKEAGLGVGLSISQGIVEAHGGKLGLEATSSRGTTFGMRLPNWKRP
jgi:PAS domain S-box-containing protein